MATPRWHGDFQRLLNNLARPGYQQYPTHVKQFHDFIVGTAALRGLLDALVASASDFDLNEWSRTLMESRKRGGAQWPVRDIHKVRACWHLIEACVQPTPSDPGSLAALFSVNARSNFEDGVQLFTRLVVHPFVEYIQARLNSDSNVVYLLERYGRRCEWFDQAALYERYLADTRRGENLYDTDLRRFLFESGIDNPFSQPRSASGEADVVADLDTSDPLVCEVKLFDGDNYGIPYVAKGVRQAVRYAHDYRTAVAHLVVFNLSTTRLQLPTDAPNESRPPRLVIESVTVFLFVVQAKPLPSASADRRAEVLPVTRDDLVRMTDGA